VQNQSKLLLQQRMPKTKDGVRSARRKRRKIKHLQVVPMKRNPAAPGGKEELVELVRMQVEVLGEKVVTKTTADLRPRKAAMIGKIKGRKTQVGVEELERGVGQVVVAPTVVLGVEIGALRCTSPGHRIEFLLNPAQSERAWKFVPIWHASCLV